MNLFRPIVHRSKFHRNFENILAAPYRGARDVISAWAEGLPNRDGKFVQEFQTTFNSSFWEIYIFAVLQRFGFTVDFSFTSPDFCVVAPTQFCIEAVIAEAPSGAPRECDIDLESFWGDLNSLKTAPLVDQATVRLANAISSKHVKFQSQYCKMDHVRDRPFVLAIAPFEQPFSYLQLNRAILRVLFGYDSQSIDQTNGDKRTQWMRSIRKPNGSEIPLGYFTNRQMEDVSARLFSTTATLGKVLALSTDSTHKTLFRVFRFEVDTQKLRMTVLEKQEYTESLLDGLSVFYNPFAKFPLARATFGGSEVAHYSVDISKGVMRFDIPNGALFHRLAAMLVASSRKTNDTA